MKDAGAYYPRIVPTIWVFLVTAEITTGDPWTAQQGESIAQGGALFHLPPALQNAYGDAAAFDLSTASGLLDYVMAFVNGKTVRTKPLLPEQRVRGREGLRALLRSAALLARGDDPGELNLAKPSDALMADLRQRGAGIRWMHRLTVSAGWAHHAIILDADEFYSLVGSLLMDEANRSHVGECKHCGKFFPVVVERDGRPGRPLRDYCDKRHRTAAHEKNAAGRQRKVRATRALKDSVHGYDKEQIGEAVSAAMAANPRVTTVYELTQISRDILRSKK